MTAQHIAFHLSTTKQRLEHAEIQLTLADAAGLGMTAYGLICTAQRDLANAISSINAILSELADSNRSHTTHSGI
jgi:hypothetical protein